jgi:hypothetical protein
LSVTWKARTSARGPAIAIASGHVTASRAGRVRIRLSLTATGRRLLATGRRVTVVAAAAFAARGKGAVSVSRTVTVKR